MSMNVVIIAALAIIVLVVLIIIFTSKSKTFVDSTDKTEKEFDPNRCDLPGTNRECMSETNCVDRGGIPTQGLGTCFAGQICCSL